MSLVVLLPLGIVAVGGLVAYLLWALEPGSGTLRRARQVVSPLAHELPYWQITPEGVVIGVDLSYAAALELVGVDTDCLDDDTLTQLQRSLHGVLHVLPAGTRLQWIHSTDHDHGDVLASYRGTAVARSPIASRVVQAKAAAIDAAPHLRRSRLHLIAAIPHPLRGGAKGWRPASPLARPFPAVTEKDHHDALRRTLNLRDQLRRGLVAAGVEVRDVEGPAMRALIYEHLNPRRATWVAAPNASATPPWADEQTAREQLAFAGVAETPTSLALDGRRLRALTLSVLPTVTEPALLEGLTVSLPFACRVQLCVEVLDDQRALDQLKRRRDQAYVLATVGEKRNAEAEAQHRDVEALIDQNLQASIRMVRVALTVLLSVDDRAADAEEQLDAQTAEVLRLMASLHGAQGLIEEYAQLDTWLATLPGNVDGHQRWHMCTSENATHMLLAWQSWQGHRPPALLLENGRNYLVGLDPFAPELDNPNAFMAGASGAGKSVTTSYLLMHLLATGAKALVIDVGGSYRKLIELFGGDYISFEAEADPALNVFYDPADMLLSDGSLDPLRLRFLLTVLESLLTSPQRPQLSHNERLVLDTALRGLYDVAVEVPILQDLYAYLLAYPDDDPEDAQVAHQLARDLRYCLTGAHGRLLNRRSTICMTTDFAAFDLKGVPEDLRRPLVLILSAVIWNLVTRDPSERKIVVFDEVWTLLSSPASAQLLEELYRTSRKYRCSILAISQSVDDFTGSSIASALVNNSATSYLLRHRAGHDVIAEQFHLNARERHVFEGLEMRRGEYSEVLVLSGTEHHFVARVVLTPLEYWIATTHPADRAALAAVRRDHPHLTLLDALELCAQRWPRGAGEQAIAARAAA